ncbi:MAG: LexA family transcriptional regulator [Oscillospiraceae bacterium]|nr:LexA family transcriptional regulator [Oscillospiraceae bacterium]
MGRPKKEEKRTNVINISTGKTAGTSPLPVICEQVRYYRTLRNLEQKQLAKELGITANAVSNWEQGRSRPDVALIPDLCRVLGISFYELYGLADPNRHNENEMRHLKDYRQLNRTNRTLVDGLMGNMLRLQNAENTPKLIRLRCFDKPLAAGIGDPTEFEGLSEEIYLYDSDEFRRADYVFRVNGDSMEPEYRNGDLVLVERIPNGLTLQEGEIGAFIVGNEMYIKEYRRDGLHSLNKKYDVLKFDEEQAVYLIGKVLTVLDNDNIASQSDVEKFQLVTSSQAPYRSLP